MTTGYGGQLATLLNKDRHSRSYDWQHAETELGLRLPPDYIHLIEEVGGGLFDGFIWLFEPDCPNRNFDLVRCVREREEGIAYLVSAGMDLPEAAGHPARRLVAFASTDTGSYFHWLADPAVPPAHWPVLVNERSWEAWASLPATASECLYKLLTGQLRIEFFGTRLPREEHSFRSSSDTRS